MPARPGVREKKFRGDGQRTPGRRGETTGRRNHYPTFHPLSGRRNGGRMRGMGRWGIGAMLLRELAPGGDWLFALLGERARVRASRVCRWRVTDFFRGGLGFCCRNEFRVPSWISRWSRCPLLPFGPLVFELTRARAVATTLPVYDQAAQTQVFPHSAQAER